MVYRRVTRPDSRPTPGGCRVPERFYSPLRATYDPVDTVTSYEIMIPSFLGQLIWYL